MPAFGLQGGLEALEAGKGLGQLIRDHLLVAHPEALEEGLVHQAADGVVGSGVDLLEIPAEDVEGQLQGGSDVLVLKAEPSDQRLGSLALPPQAGLLLVKELTADALLVVHVKELALLILDLGKDAPAAGDLLLGRLGHGLQTRGNGLPNSIRVGLAQANRGVVPLDRGLHEMHRLVALGALSALVAGADEVLVEPTVALVAGVGQTASAGAAEDRSLQVVPVDPVALAGGPMPAQHGLDLLEELVGDECFVTAGIGGAFEDDLPRVVGVAEHVVDAGEGQRPDGPAGRRTGPKATRLQQRRHVGQGVEAGGVGLEGPAHDRPALWVNDHRPHLPTARQWLTDVQIADRRPAVSTADLDLALDAPGDLLGDLDPPGRGHGGHHPLKHDAVGGVLADRLLDRDQLGAGPGDQPAGRPVILLVARPAADAPDDDVVDVLSLADLGDQLAEGAALQDGAAGDPRLDVLADDFRSQARGLPLAGLALGRDGETLGVVVSANLPSRRDPQVDDGPPGRLCAHAALRAWWVK